MNLRGLRLSVGVVIVVFMLLALFFWARGYAFNNATPAEQGAAKRKAAQQGVYRTGDPIIH